MKNFLVVGGSSGIGKSLVHLLAGEGHKIFATYRTQRLFQDQSNIHYSKLDVLNDKIEFDFLPDALDGVVYCPGSIVLKPFGRIKPDSFIEDYQLQVIGAIKVLQNVSSKLKRTEDASVVLFSTVAVQSGFPFHTQVSASKGAIEGLTRSLAAEWAPKIRVNAIAPSLTKTPLANRLLGSAEKESAHAERHPLKRIGTPEYISNMAAFLLSPKSSWMTGQIIHIDGGMSSIKSS